MSIIFAIIGFGFCTLVIVAFIVFIVGIFQFLINCFKGNNSTGGYPYPLNKFLH